MAQINFPTATSNGQTFEADNGVIYTYVGTPPNGFWSGSFQATGLTTLDARFLKLDSSNDPVTGGLNITGGNVGIGTSTPNDYDSTANDLVVGEAGQGDRGITIASGTSHRGTVMFADGTSGLGEYAGYLQYNHNGDYLAIATNNSEAMRITSTGNVGIGTANPSAPLEVQTASGERIRFNSAGNSQQPRIQLIRDSGADYSIQNSLGVFEILQGSNDIYRYASDIHQFFTAGSGERMRIASNGYVGIGTSSPSRNLVVNSSTGNTFISIKSANTGIAGILLGDQQADNVGQISYSNSANSMQFLTAASEKMRVTSGGNFGIGTTSPGSRLQIGDGTANSSNFITFGKRVTSSQTNLPKIGHTSDGTNSDLGICATSGGGSIRFFTGNGDAGFGASSNAERMRILSDGSMMFGQMVTTSPGNGNTSTGIGLTKSTSGVRLHVNMSGTTGLFVGRNNNGTCTGFQRAGVQVGRIIINTSSVSYSTSSDYRLKENVVVLDNAIDRVKQLLPKRFNFINDSLTLDGFLAHEAQTVVPEAVDGSYNETEPIGTLTEWDGTVLETDVAEPDDLTWEETVTDEDGNESTETRTRTWTQTGTQPVYQSIDQAKLVPLLTAALQEAIAKIETLDQRLADAGIE